MYFDRPRNDELIKALEGKGATKACSRCGRTRFEIVGESQAEVTQNSGGLIGSFMKQQVATVIVACSHCGNLSYHSIGILTDPRKDWL